MRAVMGDDEVPDITHFDTEHCHSYLHYYETGHAYALEVSTRRVWDYASNAYVHALLYDDA